MKPHHPPRPAVRALLALSAAAGLLVSLCTAAEALPPPTELDVPIDGSRPRIPGEANPPAGSRLSLTKKKPPAPPKSPENRPQSAKTANAATPANPAMPTTPPKPPEPPEPPEPPPAVRKSPKVARPMPRRTLEGPVEATTQSRVAPPPTLFVMLDVGQLVVPTTVIMLGSGFDTVPDVGGVAFDLTVMRPANQRHSYGARIGVAQPTVPAANWYDADGSATPRWHDLRLTFIAAAFEYAYRRKLIGPVGIHLRFGLGANLAVGELERAEVLPTCKPPLDRCPHWREVGRHGDLSLPSPIWPSLRATGGLFVDLGDHFGLHVDAGLRDAVWVGAGLSFRK